MEEQKNLQGISKIEPSIRNKYNWKGLKYPPKKDDCTNFEKNDLTIMCYMFEKDIHLKTF